MQAIKNDLSSPPVLDDKILFLSTLATRFECRTRRHQASPKPGAPSPLANVHSARGALHAAEGGGRLTAALLNPAGNNPDPPGKLSPLGNSGMVMMGVTNYFLTGFEARST